MTSLDWTFVASGHPVEFLSLSGKLGAQVRATVHSFGPLLLGKVLDLNETQTSILALVFKYCDDNDLPLLDLKDLTATLKFLSSDEGKPILADYGGMSSASVGVLLRSIVVLEQEGADTFFGEPEFEVEDLLRTTPEGEGIISILELSDVMDKPRLFSTFMLWMLAQLYESLPEVGDLPKPKLCFFFDEAHLLFDDASEALLDQVERTARLIRSKGVGIYFVTQVPTDVPSSVLAQLGNRVQHALRVFTPDDADALRKTARTFPMTDFFDIEKTITSLGTGEALVTVLSPRGVPTALAPTRLLAPDSLMAPIDAVQFQGRIATSPFADEVRRDRRPRQRLRADHRPDRGGQGGVRGGRGRGRDAGRRGPDDGDRAEHDDAGPAAARDRAPGTRDGRGPEGGRARAQGAGEGRSGTRRAPSRRSIDTAIRTGGKVVTLAARAGPRPRHLRDAVRGRQGQVSADRAAVPTGARTWLDPAWRAGALAWAEAELAAAGRIADRAAGAAARPAVVDRDPPPDRWRPGLVQGERSGLRARRAAAGGVPRTAGCATCCCRWPFTRRHPWLLFEDGGPTLRATRPDGTGDHDIGAWERILAEYAALQRSLEGGGGGRGDAGRRDAGWTAGPPRRRAGAPARGRGRVGSHPAGGT